MSTPLHMPVATPTPYPTSPNPTTPVILSLSLYLTALLISALILRYLHQHSNPPLYECHISQPLPLMNLPTHPHLTLSPFRSVSSPHLASMLSSSLLSPPLPSSLPSKGSLHTNRTSLVNSWSNSSIMLSLPNSSISEHAQMTSLLYLACPFTPPSPCCLDQSLTSSSPTPSTATWKSSPRASSTPPSPRSFSPSPQAEQCDYLGQVRPHPTSPAAIPLALRILSLPPSPTTSPVNADDVIRIQIAEGQWITSSASRVLVQHLHSHSPNTCCYICSDLSHCGLFCPMHICSTCGEAAPGHAMHHCLATQCSLCLRWGHSNDVCNLRICGRCNTPGHVVNNCPVNLLTQPDARSTYGGTYSDNNDLNTLVDDN